MFRHLLDWYTIYTFLGVLAPNGILPAAKYTLRPSVAFPVLAVLLHGIRAVGISQSLWRVTRNGIAELSQRAPPIFGRAAITFGIGPRSNTLVVQLE